MFFFSLVFLTQTETSNYKLKFILGKDMRPLHCLKRSDIRESRRFLGTTISEVSLGLINTIMP